MSVQFVPEMVPILLYCRSPQVTFGDHPCMVFPPAFMLVLFLPAILHTSRRTFLHDFASHKSRRRLMEKKDSFCFSLTTSLLLLVHHGDQIMLFSLCNRSVLRSTKRSDLPDRFLFEARSALVPNGLPFQPLLMTKIFSCWNCVFQSCLRRTSSSFLLHMNPSNG